MNFPKGTIIPGRAESASPESIATRHEVIKGERLSLSDSGYGFRARPFGPPRNDDLELPEQPSETLDAVIDAAAAQRVPDDRLVRGHAIDAELALQHVERAGRRPMR